MASQQPHLRLLLPTARHPSLGLGASLIGLLPDDSLNVVLSLLPARSLAILGSTCVRLCERCAEPVLWRGFCRSLWAAADESDCTPKWYGCRVRLLRGAQLCCTGLDSNERAIAAQAAEAAGGEWAAGLEVAASGRVSVTHLLCENAFTGKARAAFGRTRVVRLSWLHDSIVHGILQPPAAHAVPPLLGAVICTSGFPPAGVDQARNLVLAHGGAFSGSLSRRVTHLVVRDIKDGQLPGPKVSAAQRWGIPIIKEGWLRALAEEHRASDHQPLATAGPASGLARLGCHPACLIDPRVRFLSPLSKDTPAQPS